MQSILRANVKVGDRLPTVSRQYRLADFVRGDEKTIHTSAEAAQAEGLPGPVAIGPQVAALIFRQLRQAFGESWVVGGRCALTFRRPIPVEEFCSARGRVTEVQRRKGGVLVTAEMWVEDSSGQCAIIGECTVTL